MFSEVSSLLQCYARGLCIAARADVEVATRSAWKLDRFLWFKPALRTRAFQIQVQGLLLKFAGAYSDSSCSNDNVCFIYFFSLRAT